MTIGNEYDMKREFKHIISINIIKRNNVKFHELCMLAMAVIYESIYTSKTIPILYKCIVCNELHHDTSVSLAYCLIYLLKEEVVSSFIISPFDICLCFHL